MTLKVKWLVALPAGVTTPILPVFAPAGTVALMWVSEYTMKLVAATPPKVTLVASLKFCPAINTLLPSGPNLGEKLLMDGDKLKTVPPGLLIP